jgi:hypothetical protein
MSTPHNLHISVDLRSFDKQIMGPLHRFQFDSAVATKSASCSPAPLFRSVGSAALRRRLCRLWLPHLAKKARLYNPITSVALLALGRQQDEA